MVVLVQVRRVTQEQLELQDCVVLPVFQAPQDHVDQAVHVVHQVYRERLFQAHQEFEGHRDLMGHRELSVHRVTVVQQVIIVCPMHCNSSIGQDYEITLKRCPVSGLRFPISTTCYGKKIMGVLGFELTSASTALAV